MKYLLLAICFLGVVGCNLTSENSIDVVVPAWHLPGETLDSTQGCLVINIDVFGVYTIADRKFSFEQLESKIRNEKNVGLLSDPRYPQAVIIRADQSADYKYVLKLMLLCKQLDVEKISLASYVPNSENPELRREYENFFYPRESQQ